ncbi:MAG: hypothetical protein LBQ69_03810 [Treponema sp.]|nr:hypothetical protein [Treponema sp.]
MAFIPFWGDDPGIVQGFGNEVYIGIRALEGFTPIRIDMTNVPPDVPPGGFPPYVCPSPSTTRESPYAITGEATLDKRTGQWRLRLNLWRMSDNRLIISDELTAADQEDCRNILPSILTWMFSWAKEEESAQTIKQIQIVYFTPTEPPKWLYLGLRGGGSMRIYSDQKGMDSDQSIFYDNFHFAFHANLQFLSFLGIQLEAIYTHILGDSHTPNNDQRLESSSFIFPFMLRASYRLGSISLAAFGGGYYWVPIGEITNSVTKSPYVPYKGEVLLGYVAGIMFGNKVGPGYLYFDIRWASDFSDHGNVNDSGKGFHRNMFSVGLGYELGLIAKKR